MKNEKQDIEFSTIECPYCNSALFTYVYTVHQYDDDDIMEKLVGYRCYGCDYLFPIQFDFQKHVALENVQYTPQIGSRMLN